jgi:WD40 repeat protein
MGIAYPDKSGECDDSLVELTGIDALASIFLSHSSQDNEVAGDLSRRLKEHGYDSLFLDFDPDSGIKAGRDWERELYRNLKLARGIVVLCSEHSMKSRWCFVEIAQAKALGKAIFPVTISPCRIESILDDRQAIDMAGLGADEGCRRLFGALRAAGLDPQDSFDWDPKRPPFPGLSYFDAEDAGIYFGREDDVRLVIETLTRMQRQGEPRLLVLVGSSGSGKSSLVRAGVLPRLSKERSRWVIVAPFRPGLEPISELARSLSLAFPDGTSRPDWKAIRDRLREESCIANPGDGSGALATSVLNEYADDLTMLLGRREASVLLVVDQSEELLQSAAGEEASAFLDVLRRTTERRGGRVFGLLTLRSDFLGSFQNHPALRGVAFADLPLSLLPVKNFPQVIEGPADRAAIALEPGVVSSMIADARTDDALPLLAFTLREMYERCRDQERLTLKVYRDDLGGIKGAVARVVERIKSESTWTPEVARALRRAFLKFVRVNDEGQFIRQPCRWADLPDLAAPVLEAFVRARLLSSNGDVVEVTHESLFRVWPELAGWLDESRELMLWKKTIQDDLNDWIAHDRSPLYLLSGARVVEGRRWLGSSADDLPGLEGEFITASIAAEDARIARERAQQEKLRWFARVLAVAAVTASVLGFYAFLKRNEANEKAESARRAEENERKQLVIAERASDEAKAQTLLAERATEQARSQTRIATSRRLAVLSTTERDKRLDLSLILAVEALRADKILEARNCLFDALRANPGLTSFLHVDEGHVRSVAFSPDGRAIAAGYSGSGSGGGVALWDAAGRKRLPEAPLDVKQGIVSSVAFSPDGKTIAAGCGIVGGGGVALWDATRRERLGEAPLEVKEGFVGSVAFSPDGRTIAAGYGDGARGGVVLWDTTNRQRLREAPLVVKEGEVTSVAFSRDGETIAAGYRNLHPHGSVGGPVGGVVLWKAAGRERLAEALFDVKEGSVDSVAFSPDGKTIAAGYGAFGGGSGGGVVLWDAAGRKRLLDVPLYVKEGDVNSVVFSPDGKTIAAGYFGGGGGGVMLWDAVGHKRLVDASLDAKKAAVSSVAFGPDGKTIATGYTVSGAGGVMLWDVAGRGRLVDASRHVREGDVYRVAFSPDAKTIMAGYGVHSGSGCGVVLWDTGGLKRLVDAPLDIREGDVHGVAFSPDGKTIAAGYSAVVSEVVMGGIVLWDTAGRRRLIDAPLEVKEGPVRTVAFSPDGKTIAAGYAGRYAGDGGGMVLWDAANRKRLVDAPLGVKEGFVSSVAFSPDGKTIAAGYEVDRGGGGVVLWDAAGRSRLGDSPLEVKEGAVSSVAFSPDGKAIAAGYIGGYSSGGVSGGVVLWDASGRKRVVDAPLDTREGYVLSVTFSPDAKTVAAGYGGGVRGGVVLWEAAGRARLVDAPLDIEDGDVRCVAFSPDGKTIAASYTVLGAVVRGGVVLWDVNLESWESIAAQIANRNLTRAEWRQYFPDEPYRATFPDLPVPAETPRN